MVVLRFVAAGKPDWKTYKKRIAERTLALK